MERTGTLWAIGHSIRPFETFLGLLQDEGIKVLVDARRFAVFGRVDGALAAGLGLRLRADPDLGGRRTAREGTPHTARRNARFRGCADYMDTDAYAAARRRWATPALERRTAAMRAVGKRRQAFGGTSCSRRPFSSSVTT